MTAFNALGEHSVSLEMHGFSGSDPIIWCLWPEKKENYCGEKHSSKATLSVNRSTSKQCKGRRDLPAFASTLARRNVKDKNVTS